MKHSLIVLLLTSFLFPVYGASTAPKGYWRRIHATDEEKKASDIIMQQHKDYYQAHKKDKQDYKDKLSLAKEVDKKQYLENQESIWREGLKETDEPYTFMAQFDSTYYYGANLELLNGSNQSDAYSFMQYTFDTGLYIHPHTHHLENETIEFKVMARMKGVAGDSGRYMQTEPKRTKLGWAFTEYKTSTNINRFSLWARELWLKYYFDQDQKSFISTGLFPYSIGHGIALGNGHTELVGQPLPGRYTLNDIDQFRPGILASSTFCNDQALWDLYLGFGTNYNSTFQNTAEHAAAQNTEQILNASRGIDKHSYIVAAQIKARPKFKNPDTQCIINPYFVLNYDNTQHVEFKEDSYSRLYTFGGCFEWDNGPLSISIEGAQNLGHQKVKAWDRNELIFSAVTWNTHLLFINPDLVPVATYPATLAIASETAKESLYTHALGIPNSPTSASVYTPDATPATDYSRRFANGEIFPINPATGMTPDPLFYKNSNSRFRNAYKNTYRGWFVMGDIGYQFKKWRAGSSLGILSGDNSPNDSDDYILATRRFAADSSGTAFTYKDTDKKYKGFTGTHEMFKSKSINPCFIHEVQKLNCPLVSCPNLTTPQLTNLLFVGWGLKHHSVYKHKEFFTDFNFILYSQKAQTTKDTSMPYTEFIALDYSAARQTDAKKNLDPYLGIEFNASAHHKITHDLDISGTFAIFVPGKYYNTAEGKYISYEQQKNLIVANQTAIFTIPEQFNITLGKDIALFATVGITYSFDSLFFKNMQKAYKPRKTIKIKEL
ncbi:MAG: hypothetical protein ACJAZS_000053 [Alteromonas naphthalenivorans]|jgi:hypothetical protein